MTAETFQQALESFDPLLSVRAARYVGKGRKWVVERKAHIPPEELDYLVRRFERVSRLVNANPKNERYLNVFLQLGEERLSATSGRRVVVIAEELNDKLFNVLALGDMSRYGGYSRFMDEYEARERQGLADEERMAGNERMATHNEVYDRLNFAWRRKDATLLHGKNPWV